MNQTTNRNKMRATDRCLVLKVLDSKKPRSATGMIDTRLFNGDNRLHCILDEKTLLWYFKLDCGNIPPVLRQKFTRFNEALNFAKTYYKSRNVEVVQVID
jgi:hypothetical protein